MTANPLTELAERVERLTGPCRETDCEIAAALGWVGVSHDGDIICWHDPKGMPRDDIPYFTGLLDAAMTLLVAGWEWEITNLYGRAQVNLPLNSSERGWQQVSRKDDNVILALVECILRARAASENSHG